MTPDIQDSLRSALCHSLGHSVKQLELHPVGGGSINQTYEIIVDQQQRFFGKINSSSGYPGLFEMEAEGLRLLSAQMIFRIPEIIAFGRTETLQWLILEWIENRPQTNKFWKCFGEKLAALHTVTNDFFGLDNDNYMGALKQSNKKSAQWDKFFMQERLQAQVKLATDNGYLERAQVAHFERLYAKLYDLFPKTKPSLIHGDLWSGNFICDQNNEPVLIDPALYFGHPAMDLGMTELFGGFDDAFYQSYATNFQLPYNFREQREICRLYPLLIHLNLFGRSYLPSIKETIGRF
jgi:protein-ribulosamine 3-kinase